MKLAQYTIPVICYRRAHLSQNLYKYALLMVLHLSAQPKEWDMNVLD